VRPSFPKAPKRLAVHVERFLAKVRVDAKTGCWNWVGAMRRGRVDHGRFRFERRTPFSHRLALAWARGLESDTELSEGVVRHRCDNSCCVNPKHLVLGTIHQNVRDMMRRGRHVTSKGLANGNGKLSDATVRRIRAKGRADAKTAERHGVSLRYLRKIVAGRCRAA
jgi:hypothetical protein